jgi:hypothetical protein
VHQPADAPPLPPLTYCLEVRRRVIEESSAGAATTGADGYDYSAGGSATDSLGANSVYSSSAAAPPSPTHSLRDGDASTSNTTVKPGAALRSSSTRFADTTRMVKQSAQTLLVGKGGGTVNAGGAGGANSGSRVTHQQDGSPYTPLYEYSLLVHPPLVIENLLPHAGAFELADEGRRALWSARLEPGASVGVYSVGMDTPLLLLLNLSFCRNVEGVLIHDGAQYKGGDDDAGADSSSNGAVASGITLTDGLGQRVALRIENRRGGGGQRHVTVYCAYWMVNTSHYRMRFRQEGSKALPAGTVSAAGDGSRSIGPLEDLPPAFASPTADGHGGFSRAGAPGSPGSPGGSPGVTRQRPRRIFPGTPGALREAAVAGGVAPLSPSGHGGVAGLRGQAGGSSSSSGGSALGDAFLREELSLQELTDLACMFSFADGGVLGFGEKRVCVQVEESEWSKPFSADTIGMLVLMNACALVVHCGSTALLI